MEIITSKVSVYEIELDLNTWGEVSTNQVPQFSEMLLAVMPSLAEHKCISGEAGGFIAEMTKGTDFAHVMEHVILELEYLADPEKRSYTGWTRKRRKKENTYIIHYGARNYLTGRLAAILAVDIVKRLIRGDAVDIVQRIEWLKEPLNYFTSERGLETPIPEFEEPFSIIQEGRGRPEEYPEEYVVEEKIELSEEQKTNIRRVLHRIQKHSRFIQDSWTRSFLEYGGLFASMIINKMQLLNIGNFIDLLTAGEFDKFYRGITTASRIIKSYRIPINFVTHSLWLYKNRLLKYIIEEYPDKKVLQRIISDFEVFFQIIYQKVAHILFEPGAQKSIVGEAELTQFKELHGREDCILIVDDDEMIRRTGRDILEYQGYRVMLAKDGVEALDIYSEQRENISLIVLDLVMPKLSGRNTYRKIKEMNPHAKILISTGYFVENEDRQVFRNESVDLITKPFRVEVFLQKIEALLEK